MSSNAETGAPGPTTIAWTDRALILAWFRFAWRGQTPRMVWLLIGSGMVGLLQAGFGYLWKVVMDTAVAGDASASGRAMIAVGIAQSMLYVFVQGTRTWMNAHIQQVARDRVYAAVLRGRLDGFRTGDLVTRLTDDLSEEKLAWFLCSGVFRAIEAMMVVAACTATMFWIAPGLTLWTLLPLPLLVAIHRRIGSRVTHTANAVQSAISAVGTLVHDAFTGVRVIQSSGIEALADRAFATLARGQAEAEVQNTRMQQLFFAQFAYGWQLALAVLLVAGGLGIRAGTVSASDFAALSGFLMTMVFQMFDFGAFVVRGRQAAASLRRLQELVDLEPPFSRTPWAGAADAPPASSEAPAAGVAFTLPIELRRPHLTIRFDHPIRVAAGALIAVTGAVGTGKSTLIQAIADGNGVGAPPAAWVPQDPALFSVTLEENIRVGQPGGPLDAIIAGACLSADVAAMPAGLATPVGERGVTLSGGQQQRLQIARALYTARPLLLLDDATSPLDAETEARFWDQLGSGVRSGAGPTVIASTHRASTLARADQVLWLRRDGSETRVTSGTHTQLLTDPVYNALYGNGAAG